MKNKKPYYKETGREIEVFEQSYKNKIPFLLKGPTGTGKSLLLSTWLMNLTKN